MIRTRSRIPLLVSTMALAATAVGGCVYSEKERVVQTPPPPPTATSATSACTSPARRRTQ